MYSLADMELVKYLALILMKYSRELEIAIVFLVGLVAISPLVRFN